MNPPITPTPILDGLVRLVLENHYCLQNIVSAIFPHPPKKLFSQSKI